MKKLKSIYYYIYYTLYKAAQSSPTIFPYSLISVLSLDAILLVLFMSFMFYYTGATNIVISINDNIFLLITFILILIPNYFIFDYQNKYKDYIERFDKLPQETNSRYKTITWIVIVLVIVNLIFSIFYADLQARKNHIGRYSTEYIKYEKQQEKKDSISRVPR